MSSHLAARLGLPVFQIGNLVRLATGSRVYLVIWRGELFDRLATGGKVQQHIYRLSDNHWDCYHEDDLLAAWH